MHTCVLPPICCCYTKYCKTHRHRVGKPKFSLKIFTTGVAYKSANKMRYFSNISVAVLGIAEDYFKINNYNWQRAKIAGTGEQHFLSV